MRKKRYYISGTVNYPEFDFFCDYLYEYCWGNKSIVVDLIFKFAKENEKQFIEFVKSNRKAVLKDHRKNYT